MPEPNGWGTLLYIANPAYHILVPPSPHKLYGSCQQSEFLFYNQDGILRESYFGVTVMSHAGPRANGRIMFLVLGLRIIHMRWSSGCFFKPRNWRRVEPILPSSPPHQNLLPSVLKYLWNTRRLVPTADVALNVFRYSLRMKRNYSASWLQQPPCCATQPGCPPFHLQPNTHGWSYASYINIQKVKSSFIKHSLFIYLFACIPVVLPQSGEMLKTWTAP